MIALGVPLSFWAWPWDLENYNRSWLIPNIIGATTKLIGNLTHQGFSTSQILTGGSSIGFTGGGNQSALRITTIEPRYLPSTCR